VGQVSGGDQFARSYRRSLKLVPIDVLIVVEALRLSWWMSIRFNIVWPVSETVG
jgi:hypothetical protein